MIVEVVAKEGRQGLFTIFVEQAPWRDIHRTIFGRKPHLQLPKTIQDMSELDSALAEKELAGARRYALWRLSRWSQSSETLRSALERLLVSERCCELLIQEFTAAGYLNDADYSRRIVATEQARGRGPAAAKWKLRRKGIDTDLATEALEAMDSDTQRSAIKRLLTTRYSRRDLSDYKERKKVIASLIRRGFSLDVVFESIGNSF